MFRISVLISGGGTNLQAVIDKIQTGELQGAEIVQVIAGREDAYGLRRAEKAGIKAKVIKDTDQLLCALKEEGTDLIVLAGYMKVLEPAVTGAYSNRIINIHPSLIPKYCGKGFYGKRVHQAVIDAKESVSGATVHFVDEGIDTGEIIIQRTVPVESYDTAESLAARVLDVEHEILAEGITRVMKKLAGQGGDKTWAE